MGRIIQQNNNRTTVYTTGENFNNLSATTNTYYIGVDVDGGYKLLNPTGGVNNLTSPIPVTYNGLTTLINTSGLTAGDYYLITDFRTCYDQPDFDYNNNPITSGNYKQGPIEPLIVLAISINKISNNAYQPAYPNDKITYDWAWNITEVTSGATYGRITERIDEFNNRTDYDHRNILFKRYKLYTYRPNSPLNGTIELLSGGTVNGVNTTFTGLTVGDVIYIPTTNPGFYEITNIIDNETMVVSGDTITSVGGGQSFYKGIEESNGNGYFSYKRINVKSNHYLEYTTFGDAIFNSYAKNNYIGNYANNYTNIASATFILSNNVFLEGRYESNKFGDYCYNNTFGTDNSNNVWGDWCYENVSTNDIDDCTIGSYFYSNIINTNLNNNVINNYFNNNLLLTENSSDFSDNIIGNFFQYNIIYSTFYRNTTDNFFAYNLIGSFNDLDGFSFYENKIGGNFENNVIRGEFLRNNIGFNAYYNVFGDNFENNNLKNYFNYNTIGNNFGNNIIDNYFNNNNISDYFVNNNIGDYFNVNKISYNYSFNIVGSNFYYNQYSNYANTGWFDLSNISTTRIYDFFRTSLDGAVGDVILGKELVMRVISTSQYFKIKFTQWTQNNNGGGFQYIRTELDSNGNQIGPDITFTKPNYSLEFDIVVPGVLEIARGDNNGIYNRVSEINYTNSSPADTEWNSIYTESINGKNFSYNTIGNVFQNNIIDNYFGSNDSNNYFGNSIGDFFNGNNIGAYMQNNVIGNYFDSNTVGDYFNYNTIGYNFNGNSVGDSFRGNLIKDSMRSNTIGVDFFNNNIGNNFNNNQIGANTYNNTFSTSFNSNSIKNNFNSNNIKVDNLNSINFGPATHVYSSYNCDLFSNSNLINRLSYYNSADVLTIVNIDA